MNIQIPQTAVDRKKIAPASLAHVVLKTPNFSKMVEWWSTVLEAELAMKTDDLAFMTYDDEHHRIAIMNFPGSLPNFKMGRGLDHIAFTYHSLEDLLATYERLKALDILPIWSVNHGPTTSMYYADPDGNKAELQVDNYSNPEDLLAWIKTADFDSNPIGVDFSPEDLIARLKAGTPREDLVRRPMIGKRGLASVPVAFTGIVLKVLATVLRK